MSKRGTQTLSSIVDEIAERIEVDPSDGEAMLRCATKIAHIGCALYDEISDSYLHISEQYAAPFGIAADAYLDIYPDYASELKYVHEDDRERYDAYYTEYDRHPVDTQIEYRIHTMDGELVHVREYMKPIFDEAGNLTHTIVVEQDITELKIAESLLRQAQKMEAVGQLSAGVAHDFNNLLAVILGNLELISEHFGHDSYLSELIDGAITAAERGGNLTNRLLSFSRKQELRPEPSDANRLIRNMFDLLQSTMGESIQVKIMGAPRLWMGQVDRALLESAVLNLAINARDAMESGGRLLIETSNFRSNGSKKQPTGLKSGRDYVRIAVSDTGSGMTADVAEHAFEPLFTTKAVGKGSGLGLSMVYGFVTQSGGHVAIDSVVGRGTTIELYLPRDTTANAESRSDELAGDPPRGRSEAVLVVESDPSVRAFAVKILERLGYVARESETAEAALKIFRTNPPIDLLMVDVALPGGMNGIDLANEVGSFRPELPVLLVSGFALQDVEDNLNLDLKPNFIQKPFRIIELARAVRASIDTAKLPAKPMSKVREIP